MKKNNNKWFGSDDSTRQRFQRATELNVSDAGNDLLQTFVNRTVQQLTLREFGLQAVIPRKPGVGQSEIINQRTAGTTGGEWVNDTESGGDTAEVGSYDRATFEFKTLLTQGQVTRKLQATGRSYADILALEMSAKAEDFANALEDGILNGNNSTIQAKQCNGFITLIHGSGGQVVNNAGNTTVGAALDLSKLDEAIDKVKGSAQRSDLVIVGSFAGIRQLNAALQSDQQFNNVTEIAAGFRVRTYDGIPIIVSTAMQNDLQIASDGTLSSETGGDTTAFIILNTRYCYLSELTPVTVMPLAKSSSQFDEFDMYWDGAPVLANSLGASLLTGIIA